MDKLISLTFLHVTASTALSASKKAYNFFWEGSMSFKMSFFLLFDFCNGSSIILFVIVYITIVTGLSAYTNGDVIFVYD
jgi:hypothetical protein